MNKELKQQIDNLEIEISKVGRLIETVQDLADTHAAELSEMEHKNEHKWGAFSETLDSFKEAISDLEGYGFNHIRNIE